jgi:hypothetical protein
VDGLTARGDVARLMNNAYNVLKTVHTGVSLSQREAFVNNGGVCPFRAISLVAAVEVSPRTPGTLHPKGT